MADAAAAPLVWFYPHAQLRERQLDTIRRWPAGRALNPELAGRTRPMLAGSGATPAARRQGGLLARLPLPNIKRRPRGLPAEAAVYVWGGVVASGPFIADLDTPYALTGYDLDALPLWRWLLRAMLGAPRCLAIRCMSRACAESLRLEFGERVAAKASVHYPRIPTPALPVRAAAAATGQDGPRFLFIATQFEIKGGAALLRAFARVRAALPGARLDLLTHLPEGRCALAAQPGVMVHPANLSRAETWARFLAEADVLVHPTYVDSFAMVVLEALAHGLAIVATDLYAIPEMVEDGVNGELLPAPLSIWDGFRPGALYRELERAPAIAAALDTAAFEEKLAAAMIALGDPARLAASRAASRALFERRFAS